MASTPASASTWTQPVWLGTWMRVLLLAVAGGVALAVVTAYAYYNDPWRPLGHTLGVWAVLASAVGFRRPPGVAIGASIAALAAGVVTRYVGLKVGHDIRWAEAGSVMPINWDNIHFGLLLSVPAGVVFGLLGSLAPRGNWKGAGATAVVLGLLLGDAYRRFANWGGVDVAVAIDVLVAVAVFVVVSRLNKRPALTLALTVAAAVLGFIVISAPDLLQRGLIAGF